MDTTMIEVRDLVKSYGQNRALKGISIQRAQEARSSAFWVPTGPGRRRR